jgi:diguanylate cyclase (GGDEF)-like protein
VEHGPRGDDPNQAFANTLGWGAFNSLSEPICVVGQNGRILAVNAAWTLFSQQNGGDPLASGEGANYFQNVGVTSGERAEADAVVSGIQDVLAGRSNSVSCEYSCHSANTQRWFCARITRFVGPGPPCVVVVHEDVTLRTRAETRSARILQLYAALNEANACIARASSRQQLLQQVCDVAAGLDIFKLVSARLIDPATHLLQSAAQRGDDKGYFSGTRISMLADDPDGAGPIAVALRARRAAIVQDLERQTVSRPALAYATLAGIRSYAAYPLFIDDEVVGAFCVYAEQPEVFDSELSNLLAALANDLSMGLQNLDHETRRSASDQLLRRHLERANLLTELGASALGNWPTNRLMLEAATLARDTLGFEFASIFEFAQDGYEFLQKAAVGWPSDVAGFDAIALADAGEIQATMERHEALRINDFSTESRFSTSSVAKAAKCICGILVAIPGRSAPYGVLAVYARTHSARADDDVAYLRSIANLVAASIYRDQAVEHLERAAQFDALTGLPNRQLFGDRLAQTVIQAKRMNRAAATLNISLNRFKLVNETFGHQAGNDLLIMVSRRISQSLRDGDTIGRLEGDMFGVVLSDLAKAEDAILATQKILLSLEKPFAVHARDVFVTVTIGIAAYPGNGDTQDALMENADAAMQRVKQQQGSGFQFYTKQMNARSVERLHLELELRQALERNEFVLFYQPKVDVATGGIAGAESLIRWRHPQRGLVFPGDFIAVLEETSLIVQVGSWVIKEACEQVARWIDAGVPVPRISVNVSPRQFQHRDFAAHVGEIIRASGVDARYIELEITESMLMIDPAHAVYELAKLKELGVGLSVDDFGTGYSSLAYLKRFPLDTLKIDIAFIRDTCTDPDSAAITLAIINLAHNLRLKVVAEGVETAPQFNFLAGHSCDQLQGYLFSKPIEVEAFEHLLRNDVRLNVPRTHRSVQPTLLIVDRSEPDTENLIKLLDGEGYRIFASEQPTSALQLLSEIEFQVIIASSEFENMSGIEFLSQVRQMYPSIGRIIAIEIGDPQEIVDAVNAAGIHKFLFKEWSGKRIRETIRAALEEKLLATSA